jgi:small conductance mechanosensitive channel
MPRWEPGPIMPRLALLLFLLGLATANAAETQEPRIGPEERVEAPLAVDVVPQASDLEIAARLHRILLATGWYESPGVEVNDGVVFLRGRTGRTDHRQWAGDLARNTQAVVAVVNRIEVVDPPAWDVAPAFAGLRELGREVLRNTPYILFSVVILLFTWYLALLAARLLRRMLRGRRMNALLLDVVARGAGILVFIAGLYSVFHVTGLTNIALAVLGGTGLAGIALGIAFRDITENFLASIFLSAQNPFRTGDLIEVGGTRGFVQRMTTRATVLMTPDGNHVQVPNAIIYKSNITNFSANPNERMEFTVTIGLEDSITRAQELVLDVLARHPAVLEKPEPWVVAAEIRNAAVVLRISFWFCSSETGGLQVRSALIRLVKRALQDAGISIPAEQRHLVRSAEVRSAAESTASMTAAEAQSEPEAEVIRRQAAQAPMPEEGENLLND